MNFYNILQVPVTATRSEIKKAYHKLAIQYHPDKCTDSDAQDKFIKIKMAYDILLDDDKRKQYDGMSNDMKYKLFDLVKDYFTEVKPNYAYVYNDIINILYSGDENDLKNDINNFDIKKIFTKIADNLKSKRMFTIYASPVDMIVSLEERYNYATRKVRVFVNDYKYNFHVVPIFNKKVVINDEDIGEIVVNVVCDDTQYYKQINDHDLLTIQYVSLSQYIYGSKIMFRLPNYVNECFEFDCCLEKKPVFILLNKGLVCDEEFNRGSLHVYVVIEGIYDNDVDDNTSSYALVMRDTLQLIFPPINC